MWYLVIHLRNVDSGTPRYLAALLFTQLFLRRASRIIRLSLLKLFTLGVERFLFFSGDKMAEVLFSQSGGGEKWGEEVVKG